MDKYNIVYTNAAANDIAEKFQYITSVLHVPPPNAGTLA